MKTLFVRPKKPKPGGFPWEFVYWSGFIQLFPSAKPGFAEIPAFTEAGIEIVVIGADVIGHPYDPMRQYDYDPGDPAQNPIDFDPDQNGQQLPPCDIMEVVYQEGVPYSAYGEINLGHTFFTDGSILPTGEAQWLWDTKGHTPGAAGIHGYRTPEVYPVPLDNYFIEGAYTSMAVGQTPVVTDCDSPNCDMVDPPPPRLSPMNLNDTDYTQAPQFTLDGGGNIIDFGTVEFNDITLCKYAGDGGCVEPGEIKTMGSSPRGKGYARADVLRRTLVHEMGVSTALKEPRTFGPKGDTKR
jgi:hypothetical protein